MLQLGATSPDPTLERQATDRGIGVMYRLEDVIEVLLHLQQVLSQKRGVAMRLADWFGKKRDAPGPVLPMNPRTTRPIPTAGK
jgi:hypothetical protein